MLLFGSSSVLISPVAVTSSRALVNNKYEGTDGFPFNFGGAIGLAFRQDKVKLARKAHR